MRNSTGTIILALLAVSGCSSDPCSGKTNSSGTCITLHVTSMRVTQLEQLGVASSINGMTPVEHNSPSSFSGTGTFTLPFDIALIYPAGQSGDVALAAGAITMDNITAEGTTTFTLASGVHQQVSIMLDSAAVQFDMATPDLATQGDMGPTAVPVVAGKFAWFEASKSVLAAVTSENNTLQIYDYPSGQLKATLDSGVATQLLYVSDSIVLYCANPITIGTTANQSCTLKMWKPGDTTGTQLATGVYPFEPRVSADGTVLSWSENVDATATKADYVSWFSGAKTTLGTQMPIADIGALIFDDVLFAVVPAATAGQFDIVRAAASGNGVHICTNCDQLALKNDGTMIAARSTPVNNLGKLVVAASTVSTANALGTSTMGSTTSDVTSLIDYFDAGSVMYFSASGAGKNIREWVSSSNTVTTRLADGSAEGFWNDNGALLAFYKTMDGNGVGDLWLLPSLSGAPVLFDTGGKLYDLTSDGRFTFSKEPTTTSSTWFVEVGSGLTGTPVATLKAPSASGRIVNPTRVAYFSAANTYDLVDYVSGVGFSWSNVLETETQLDQSRLMLLFSGTASDGIFAYTY